ncbi:lipopolysaccharide biosynthesis protein [Halococcus agarilyticus]|uniref:lipopolysaccharide biosynthesis protein n=1 Tax=Halococcus agarilyticus TaxID=1232219 RepID=UPI000677AB9B|nr:lipopolysaccharide biosynthesis protein [Halococcus agarilyticus]
MRLGRTSAIHFGSQVISSVVGFVATLYIARGLGSATLGTYSLFVAVVIWLKVATGTGLQQAVKKRISERDGGSRDLGAGVVVQVVAFVVVALAALALSGPLTDYLRFDSTHLLVVTLATTLGFSFVDATLQGEQKVHLAALLTPLDRVVRSGLQLAVVFFGALGGGIAGLIWGYVAGAAVAGIVGLAFVTMRPRWPGREGFERVLGFARYSWLSGIEGRSFSSMDTIVLGLFVASNLIGYYEVAWNLASILAVFGTSISDALFPALSQLSSEDDERAVAGLINDALAYTGLFVVPGLAGVVVVGDRVLAIYGGEFRAASTVLVLLVVARLVYAYEAQLVSTLYAIDRPGVAFRVNVAFVVANLGLNLLLVALYGWIGAAVATTIAAVVGLVLAHRALSATIAFDVPVAELGRQWLAAVTMGGAVAVAERLVADVLGSGIIGTVLLVGFGAAVYFVALLGLSGRLRATVADNIAL